MTMTSSDDVQALTEMGYVAVCGKGAAGLCGVSALLFTGALWTHLTATDTQGRYCYTSVQEALEALRDWDGNGDPPGDWIKYKCPRHGHRYGPGMKKT